MKKIITVLMASLLCVCAAIGITGCKGSGASSQYNDFKSKTITVGVTNAAPMNYKKSGKWVGFDTELTVAVFNALGYKVMFKEIAWVQKYSELNSGTIDCIWNGFTSNSTDEDANGERVSRSQLVNFSMDYMINEQCIVKNKNVAFEDENSFDQKTIAFEIGSSGETGVGWLEEDYTDVSFIKKGMTSQATALQEVNAGTADFAVVDKSLADNAVSGGYTNVEIVDFDYFELEYYAIGFAKTAAGAALRDKVNTLLKAFYEVGYLEELCTKYSIDYATKIVPCFTAA
jgi:polar amino acid transport system substrate-binding protein